MQSEEIPNGRLFASLFAAALACLSFGLLTIFTHISPFFSKLTTLYLPSGSLSGKAGFSVLIWLSSWGILHSLWANKELPPKRLFTYIWLCIILGLLGTFPPFFELFG